VCQGHVVYLTSNVFFVSQWPALYLDISLSVLLCVFCLSEGSVCSFSRVAGLCSFQRGSSRHSGILDQTLWASQVNENIRKESRNQQVPLAAFRCTDGGTGRKGMHDGWVQLEWTANAKDHSHWSAVLANGTFSWCVNVPFFTFCEREHRNFSKGHRWQRVAHEQTRQQFTSRSFRHRTFSFEVLLITETNEPALSTHADSSYFGPVLQNSIISTVAADYPAKWRVSPWTGSWYQRERDTPH